jgi:hypothetical protein
MRAMPNVAVTARNMDARLTLGACTYLASADKRAALASVPVVHPKRPQADKAKATDTYGGPEWRAARIGNTGQQRGAWNDLAEGGGIRLQRPENPCITGTDATGAPLAQLDRASVYGTEG